MEDQFAHIMLDKTVKWFHMVMEHPHEKELQMMLQSVTIIQSYSTLLTGSSVSIANDTNCQAKDMDCSPSEKCEQLPGKKSRST